MRLYGALVSSFLFVSAVLAGDHPEKQQSPSLNHVEKSIDPTTVLPIADWAGIVWTAYSEEAIETVEGSFTIPHIVDNFDSTFAIMVAISSSVCNDITIGAGVLVWVTANGIAYRGFAQWDSERQFSPHRFFAGSMISASIEVVSNTQARVTLLNLDEGGYWMATVGGTPRNSRCKQDVKWIIATPRSNPTLPNFNRLIFQEMLLKVSGTEKPVAPRHPHIALENHGHPRVETCTMFYRDFAIIVYIPPPLPPG